MRWSIRKSTKEAHILQTPVALPGNPGVCMSFRVLGAEKVPGYKNKWSIFRAIDDGVEGNKLFEWTELEVVFGTKRNIVSTLQPYKR